MTMKIPVNKVVPNPDQPRTVFDEDELAGLAQSIVENDLIQPIVVEAAGDGYILIDGERRWRAHQLAGLTEIEAVVKEGKALRGKERLTQALVANIQRSAMGFVDEALAYRQLMDEYGGLEAVAQKTGVSTATISGRLSLLELAPEVQRLYNLKRLPFDLSVLAMFKRLKHEDQARVALMAVSRGWRTESILRSGRAVLNGKGRKRHAPEAMTQKAEVIVPDGKFDALALLAAGGFRKPLSMAVRTAARATCKACALYGEASKVTCRECPLPEFLKRLEGEK
jgi:ParB/RepB/Spo0J family partition protein